MGIFIYFLYVPIKYVLSNAPDQVVVVYNSAVLLVGVYITYRAVFYKDDRSTQNTEAQDVSCDAKEKEIATLEHKIMLTRLQDEENNDEIDFLWKKIRHLRIELQLQNLHSRILTTLADCHTHNFRENDKERIIDKLLTQQYKLLRYLINESQTIITKAAKGYEKDEKTRLQVEILAQLQNVLAQFWREPDKSRRNEQYGNVCIVQIIKSLPDNMTDEFKYRLLKEIDQIETVRQGLERLPEPPQQPPPCTTYN